MINRVIDEMAKWLESVQADEELVRRTIRRVLPSWRIVRDVDYGLHQSNGYQKNYIIIWKGNDRYWVPFWEYDSFWDADEDGNIYGVREDY